MNIIAFSPHPDDAEIVMGGTIAKYTQGGHNVLIVVVTIPNQREVREKESRKAAEILGAKLSILDLDPYEIMFNRRLVETFDGVIKDFPPDVVYTSWLHDSHQDHVSVSNAVVTACRHIPSSLYMYEQEIPSGVTSGSFRAQAFVDISDVLDVKTNAVLAHQSQFLRYGQKWIDAINGRAAYWGFRINAKCAEAFEVVKYVKQI